MPKRADPQITRIEPLKPRGLRVRIHLDQGEPFEVTLEALERSRLGSGDALPTSRHHRLLNDDADIRVRDAALNLLSYRARTRQELRPLDTQSNAVCFRRERQADSHLERLLPRPHPNVEMA